MEKRSRNPKSEDSQDDATGSENQSGTALSPMVADVSSYLHDYVSSYEAPDSPGSFHSAKSSPSTPSLESAQKSIPSVSGGAEGPQVVLGDSKSPISTQNKRSHGVPHVQEPQDPDEGLDDDPKAADLARRHEGSEEEYAMKTGSGAMRKRDDDEEEEHEDDPAEDNSENVPKAEPQAEAEPEEDPVTVSPTPDLPVPLPKTLPAQPALHSKAHRVHKKDDSRKHEYTEDHHHSSMAFASPGGRPAMRRQQAYTPEHRHEKHDKDKTVHVHIHHSAHSGSGHNHKRDEGHGEEGPELPAAPIFDPAGTSQDKDALKSANYVGQHAQMSPDCWEAMAAGKHMEHAQKRLAKLKRRNAMPDMANAASG